MKSASEWLASSDDEDSVASGPARKPSTPKPKTLGIRRKSRTPEHSPAAQTLAIPESDSPTAPSSKNVLSHTGHSIRLQEAEERRRKQEELRERMKATLGATTVQAVAESAALAAMKKTHAQATNVSDDSFSSAAGVHISSSALPPVVPSTRNSFDFGRARRTSIPDHLEEVDVMLADRGTQTIENVSCQTDPDPRVLQCYHCYMEYYGHIPEYAGCSHGAGIGGSGGGGLSPSSLGDGGLYGSDPVFASLMYRYSNQQAPMGNKHHHRGGAAPGRSGDGLTNAITSTALLREQLSGVQATIDMLISRYNLPPPPGMEHLAV